MAVTRTKSIPDMSGYVSTRVHNSVRQLSPAEAAERNAKLRWKLQEKVGRNEPRKPVPARG